MKTAYLILGMITFITAFTILQTEGDPDYDTVCLADDENLESIEIFENNCSYTYSIDSGCAKLLKIESDEAVIYIPNRVIYENKEYVVNEIESEADIRCANMEHLIIDAEDVIIGEKAFTGNDTLKMLEINDVSVIGVYAFTCISLESVKISGDDIIIKDGAFRGDFNLKEFICNSKTISFGDACLYTTAIQNLDVTGTVEHIGKSAFARCWCLKEVSLDVNDLYLGEYAFLGCGNLDSVIFTGNVIEIGRWAFADCKSLEYFEFSDCLKSIGSHAFSGCSLKQISLPNSLESIENYAFTRNLLYSIIIPPNVSFIGSYAFESCCEVRSIFIPESVESIGVAAFSRMNDLESVYFNHKTNLPAMAQLESYGPNSLFYPGEYIKNKYTIYIRSSIVDTSSLTNQKSQEITIEQTDGNAVIFDPNGGIPAELVRFVETDSTICPPKVPLRDNYEFTGWYLEGELYDFKSEVTSDLTLVAGWSVKESSVLLYLSIAILAIFAIVALYSYMMKK